jgi:hypothetical protein
VLEAAIVVESELGDPGASELDLLLFKAGITVAPFSPEHLPQPAMRSGCSAGAGTPPASTSATASATR